MGYQNDRHNLYFSETCTGFRGVRKSVPIGGGGVGAWKDPFRTLINASGYWIKFLTYSYLCTWKGCHQCFIRDLWRHHSHSDNHNAPVFEENHPKWRLMTQNDRLSKPEMVFQRVWSVDPLAHELTPKLAGPEKHKLCVHWNVPFKWDVSVLGKQSRQAFETCQLAW